jgi:cellulose synthase/poly-beta-1,6-N-acetylglucosamine synthase-like glycosyltransferase
LALVLSILCIAPAFFIPSNWGLSLTDAEIALGSTYRTGNEANLIFFNLLNIYYLVFIIATLLPFIFFTFSSAMVVGKQNKRTEDAKDNAKELLSDPKSPFFNNRHPKVSIIIPCYNEAIHVSSTITNCFRQDYPGDIEIIVVDDGSKDNTWAIGRIFQTTEKGREVRTFHKPNGGKSSALQFGISKCTGPLILMTDGDSGIHPKAVSSIVDTFRAYPDAGIVGGFVFIRNTHSGYLTKLQQLEYIITQHLIRINQTEDGSVLIAPGPIFGMRSDLARALPPIDRTVVEDCDLTMSIISTGFTTRATTKALSYTTAPETWKSWVVQRKRWIYGQFQAWRENRWHLKRNPWGLYTYFTWVWTTISSLLLIISVTATIFFLMAGSDNHSILEFLSLRTFAVLMLYTVSRIVVVLQYKEGRRILHYLPLKVFYDLVNGFLTAYLYLRYLSGKGVRMRWKHKVEVVH